MKTVLRMFSLSVFLLLAQMVAGESLKVWQKVYGGEKFDSAQFIQCTRDGGYIVLGVTTSFGVGESDFYVLKLDENGNKQWQKTYGGSKEDYPVSIQQTRDEGWIIAGMTKSFGAGGWDAYIVKLTGNGNKLWEKVFGGKNDDAVVSVRQTVDGGYILAGRTNSFGAGNQDFYVLRLDKDGNKVWERTYGGSDSDIAYDVLQVQDGAYIVVGATKSFGVGGMDAYILKIDENGNKLWEKTLGGSDDDLLSKVLQTDEGGYIIIGYTRSSSIGGSDVYIVKLDEHGKSVWEKVYGGARDDQAWSVQQTKDGGYIVAGWTRSFGPSMDAYILKLDSNGNRVWERTIGGEKDDLAYSIQQTADGGYIAAGWTQSFGAQQTDVYVIKMDADGKTEPYPR